MEGFDREQFDKRAKCRKKREVVDCLNCLRYEHCFLNKPLYDRNNDNDNIIDLGVDIIMGVGKDYCLEWKRGNQSKVSYYAKFLEKYTNFITNERYDGKAFLEKLTAQCEKHFGKLKPRKKRKA